MVKADIFQVCNNSVSAFREIISFGIENKVKRSFVMANYAKSREGHSVPKNLPSLINGYYLCHY